MAKLSFRYGAMNSGKSTTILQIAHNYEERNQKVLLIKSSIDTKKDDKIYSRLGVERNVDELILPEDKIIDKIEKHLNDLACILVDEVQFMSEKQIDELFYITKLYDIPVICYGLRTDFKSNGFPGSIRLLEIADELQEMATICRCGKKARFNARMINGEFVYEGDQIAIDNNNKIEYESLCGKCYLNKVLKKTIIK